MSTWSIFQPSSEDIDDLIAMHAQSWIDAYPNEKEGVSEDFIRERIKEFSNQDGKSRRLALVKKSYENPNYYLRISKNSDGKVVGFVDARRDEVTELCGLYIDKSVYSSGLADQLAGLALDWLGRWSDIKIVVVAYNKRAQGFYEKHAFKKTLGSEHFHRNTPLRVIETIRRGDN